MFLRIPGWCHSAQLLVNNKPAAVNLTASQYAEVNAQWKNGDKIELNLDMPVTMVQANPLVEETRNQVAVKRGPVVYCIESAGIPKGAKVAGLSLLTNVALKPEKMVIDNSNIVGLTGKAKLDTTVWKNQLYKELSAQKAATVDVQLIPYFAWGNRGHVDMETWMPFEQ